MAHNILSGFIGALIALILSFLVNRLINASRLNRIRLFLLAYLENLATVKLNQYIKDCTIAMSHLINKETEGKSYDEMPMLTSELIKSISQSDLFTISYNQETYVNIIDFYYAIEFLKKSMPMHITKYMAEWTDDHLKNKKIKPGQPTIKHIQTCRHIERERKRCVNNLKALSSTADNLVTNLQEIITNLKGANSKWILRYFTRQ